MRNYVMPAPDYWKTYGLGKAGAVDAAWLLPVMLTIVRLAPKSVVEAVLREARFQVDELPARDEAFRQKYLTDTPSAELAAIRAFEPIVAALREQGYDGDHMFDLLNEALCNVAPAGDED